MGILCQAIKHLSEIGNSSIPVVNKGCMRILHCFTLSTLQSVSHPLKNVQQTCVRKLSTMSVNPDLLAERKKCTFNTSELTHIIDGGPEKTAEKRFLIDFFLADGELLDDVPMDYLSHEERYEHSLKKAIQFVKKIWSCQDKYPDISAVDLYKSVAGGLIGYAVSSQGTPFNIHTFVFIPAILGQGSADQQAKWVSRAWNYEIIGTYAQTELGHGTFLRGLETTAKYDKDTEEFVLNSPNLSSYKWWPGGMGKTANYALVMAQMYTNGQCHGIHPFIVQLRDEETHMPLAGVKIGEIGSKMSMNGTDNGYLGFDHIRIPRENMLMKNSKVLPDGTYVKGASDKLVYGTMIFIRVSLIKGIALIHLVKSVTIATRYSAVRKQGMIKSEGKEVQIIDYVTQQYKLFPHIATSFAILFSADWLFDMYNDITSEMESGDLERLPELHAMACCMKAVCTSDASTAVDECRRSCGGHGYMNSSGLPCSYAMVTASQTYEGENTVLFLQTARYIMKVLNQAQKGDKLPITCDYMAQGVLKHQNKVWSNTMLNVIEAYNHVACGLAHDCAERLQKLVKIGKPYEDAWNEASNILVNCAEMHCRAFIVRNFFDKVTSLNVSRATKDVLMQLCELHSVYFLLKNLGFFLMYSNVKKSDVVSLQEWQDSLLSAIRPNAVSIVDSFDLPDVILNSALGAFDGNVYERLFEEANKSPLNTKPVHESFHKYLKPFLKSNM